MFVHLFYICGKTNQPKKNKKKGMEGMEGIQIIFFVVINTDLSEQQPLKRLKMH